MKRALHVVTYLTYPSLRNTVEAPGGKKKNFKTPTTGAKEIKILTSKNSK
jgi:hypothetical protein